ncbi:MAG: CIA30 family protein [Verrucomicrobiaceae bacterium]|nr:MAG: CIA30 family protein [Verrucomicrobiaceae bacterium]
MKNIFKGVIATICFTSFNLYGSEKILTAFENSNSDLTQWQIVDDGVMGGLSKGKFKISDSESLIFKGNLSLKNNGGFSSIRSKRTSLDLSSYKGIKIRTRGDGRNYKIRLESDSKYRRMAVSFQHEFTTVKGEWSEIFIPFEKLKASFRGWNLPNMQFNSKTIKRVGIIIADKKEGPFELEVDWIKAS